MKFFLAQCVSFILGAVVAVVIMLQLNPQVAPGADGADHRPHKTTPKRIGPPPEHDVKQRPNRPPQ